DTAHAYYDDHSAARAWGIAISSLGFLFALAAARQYTNSRRRARAAAAHDGDADGASTTPNVSASATLGVVLALAGVLLASAGSISLAQPADEASELDRRVAELYRAGRYSDAIPLAQRLLAIRERALGPNHPGLAVTLNNLGELNRLQGRYG